jgi:transglutaminase-like putative cysteine protease/Mg-chelatase subunit ChlD
MAKRLLYSLLVGLVIFSIKPAYSFADTDTADSYQKLLIVTSNLINTYEKQLGFYANPFAYVLDNDEANLVYQGLLTQEGSFFCEDSYLFKIKFELIRNHNTLNLEFIQKFLIEAESAAKSNTPNLRSKQSHLLGLKMLLPYLNRFVEQKEVTPPTNEEQPESKEEKAEKKEEKKQKKDEADPEWPSELNDSYKPHTKDLGSDEDNRKKNIIAEVNFKTFVFGQITYDSVIRNNNSPFQATDLPWLVEKSPIIERGITNEYIKIYPLGKRELKLFMPTGYTPGRPDEPEATIKSAEKGGYRLSLAKDFKELKIPLYKTPVSKLTDYLKDIYTKKVGISIEEIPEKASVAIIHKFDPKVTTHKTEEIAKAIANHLAKDYLYSSGSRPETDPIAALKVGAFQCDMAAYIMTAILRDIYNIPSRVVAGYRAKRANNDNKIQSYLLTPEDGHAWVEAFIDGSWHYFDPNPIKKDKENDKKEKEKKDFSDWDDENPTDKNNKEKKDFSDWDDENPTDKNNEDQKNNKADGNEAADDKDKIKEEVKEEKEAATASENEDKNNEKDTFLHQELDEKLHDVLLEHDKEANPIKKAAWRNILIYSLNPFQSSYDIQNKLHSYETVFEHAQELKKVLYDGREAHEKSHYPLAKWVDDISQKIFNQDINETYKDLLRIIRILKIYREVSDRSSIKNLSLEIEKYLDTTLNILDKLNSDIAEDIALVDDFKDNSPPLLWKFLREKYNLNIIGANIPTQNLAADIRAGKLNDEKLISALYGYTDFILNSSFKPGKMEVKTWLQESLTRGRDILPLTRFSDWRNTILTRPDLDIIGNMEQQAAYHLTNRKKIFTESKKEQNEAERITVVGFDTSGSMAGDLDRFQAALITAFACRAINDVTSSGKHRHKILLVPFDNKVGTPIKINNIDDISNLIKNYKSWLKNTSGGTDIQEFLLQAMALIAEAQTNTKSPLDTANIIVMSDGESPIDYALIKKARNAIHRDTPLQTMFVALGSTNPDLKRFARDAEQMGMNTPDLYRSFSHQKIAQTIDESEKNNLEKHRKAFYSLKKPSDIIQDDRDKIISTFKTIIEKTKQLREKTLIRTTTANKPEYHKKYLYSKTSALSKKSHQERKIEAWLHEFREWIKKHEIHKDPKLFELILDDLMINFEKSFNVKFEDLSHYELEQLNHLLQTSK